MGRAAVPEPMPDDWLQLYLFATWELDRRDEDLAEMAGHNNLPYDQTTKEHQ